MWREPKPKERFYAGVDTGEGISADNSVIEVVDQNGIQVFEFASNKIKAYEFADLVREVGEYFNTALLVVEKLLDEMKSFQLDDTGKQQAVKGAKDDRVMAFAMALEGLVNGIWYI